MTTPKVLTEADAAADLAGLPRAVSSEDALRQAESHAAVAETILEASPRIVPSLRAKLHTDTAIMLRALVSERAALAGRVAELEAERAWLEKRWNKVIDAAQHAHGPDAIRFKFSLRKNGTAMNNFPKWLDGRWVSFVFAEDDAHIGYIAKALDAALTTPESKP